MSKSTERLISVAVFLLFILTLDLAAGSLFGFYETERERRKQQRKANRVMIRTPSLVYHHDYLPQVSVGVIWGSERFTITTNSLGFRDSVQRTVPLKAEKYRVLFIGDSFTAAVGVDYRDSFVRIIGAEIREWAEVLNAAVISYSPIIYHRKLEYLIESLGLDIDEVVVFLDISDIEDALIYEVNTNGIVVRTDEHKMRESLFLRTPPSEPLPTPDTWFNVVKRYLKRHSITGRALAQIKRSFATKEPRSARDRISWRASWTFDDDVFAFYGEKGIEIARQQMDRLSELLNAHGIGLTLVVYPWPEQIAAGDLDSRQVRIWREWSSARQVGFVNLFPCFIGKGKPDWTTMVDRYFIPGDMHWNKAGHALVASAFLATWAQGPPLNSPASTTPRKRAKPNCRVLAAVRARDVEPA